MRGFNEGGRRRRGGDHDDLKGRFLTRKGNLARKEGDNDGTRIRDEEVPRTLTIK